MTTRACVTGAAGFIGFHLARTLAAEPDTHVTAVDNHLRGADDAAWRTLASRPNVTALRLDLTDPAAVAQLPEDIDELYHLAALNGTQNFYARPWEVLRNSTLPTLHLIDRYGPTGRLRRFVYAGSSEVYASTVSRFGWPVPTAEDVPPAIADIFNPRWSYATAKLHGEIATLHGAAAHGMPATVLRYHNVYGPRMGDAHVIPDFLERARSGVFALYGAEQTRAFLHIDDAVRATLLAARHPDTDGALLNLGGSTEISMHALARLMMEIAGLTGEIACHPAPPGSVDRRLPDCTRLARITGFAERVSLREGLAETIADILGPAHAG